MKVNINQMSAPFNMESDTTPSPEERDWLEWIDTLPSTLRPVYAILEPNQPIALYTGPLQLTQEINQRTVEMYGHGGVEFAWFPQPCIKFELLNNDSSSCWINVSVDCSLTLVELETSVKVGVLRFHSQDRENLISGIMKEPLIQGSNEDLACVLFHVANFHDFIGSDNTVLIQDSRRQISRNRITFEVESWRLTLDQLKTTKSNVDLLNSTGGFAVTHVGKLEKSDGGIFSGGEARAFLNGFADFLSFARGFRVPLVLLVGYDADKNEAWKYSAPSRGDSWRGVSSWFPTQDAGCLTQVFPGFLKWWQDWERSALIALSWYLESNANPLAEQKIILSQVALELIAWVLLVEKELTVSPEGFDKLPASDKLRLLLSKFRIPLHIPRIPLTSPLADLAKLSSSSKWLDGPHAFTEIRNGLIHPKKRQKIFDAPSGARSDAGELGLLYFELVLLGIFAYQGIYASRLPKLRYNGETEPVPWAKS